MNYANNLRYTFFGGKNGGWGVPVSTICIGKNFFMIGDLSQELFQSTRL